MEAIARRAGPTSPPPPSSSRPPKRYWAIVGNGTNRIAAEELRIKLSELCYRSIACDATEDKKHIDLSCEPLILVCAAGLDGLDGRRRRQGGGDLPRPQGVADRHRHRRAGALRRGPARDLRAGDPPAAGVRAHRDGRPPVRLRGRAGHRRPGPSAPGGAGRHRGRGRRAGRGRRRRPAALAAAGARRLRRAVLRRPAQRRLRRQPRGEHRGAAGVVVPLRARHRPARRLPGRARAGSARRPSSSTTSPRRSPRASRSSPDPSTRSSTRPRPSRSASPGATRRCCSRRSCRRSSPPGAARDRLSYKTLRTLADLDPAVAEVTGWIRYELDGRRRRRARCPSSVVDRGGIAARHPVAAPSAAGVLRGTKHTRGHGAPGASSPGAARTAAPW